MSTITVRGLEGARTIVPRIQIDATPMRDVAELLRWAGSIRLYPYTGPIESILFSFDCWHLTIKVTLLVPHRETLELVNVFSRASIAYDVADEAFLLHWFHDAIRNAVMHEVDECILIGGKRLFDPHAER